MEKIGIASLVEDMGLYPRTTVDGTHVTLLVQALEAGAKFPPIVVDEKTRAIIDGVHRTRATRRVFGEGAEIDCEVISYRDRRAMYLDACRLNSAHGKGLTGSERTHMLLKGADQGIPLQALAEAVGITVARVEKIVTVKAGTIRARRAGTVTQRVPLKGSLRHLWGKDAELTKVQAEVQTSLPGTQQWLLIKQVCDLIEHRLLDEYDPLVAEQLARLKSLLDV